MITSLNIPPGIVKRGTDLDSGPRWTDGSLVRWHDSVMQPIGGWLPYDAVTQGVNVVIPLQNALSDSNSFSPLFGDEFGDEFA